MTVVLVLVKEVTVTGEEQSVEVEKATVVVGEATRPPRVRVARDPPTAMVG